MVLLLLLLSLFLMLLFSLKYLCAFYVLKNPAYFGRVQFLSHLGSPPVLFLSNFVCVTLWGFIPLAYLSLFLIVTYKERISPRPLRIYT